jgi:hypothetical protein
MALAVPEPEVAEPGVEADVRQERDGERRRVEHEASLEMGGPLAIVRGELGMDCDSASESREHVCGPADSADDVVAESVSP